MRFGSIFGGKEGGFAPGPSEEHKAPTDMGSSDDPRWRQSEKKYMTVDDVVEESDNPEEALMRARGELDEDTLDDYVSAGDANTVEKEKNEDDKASKEEDKHEPLEQKVDEIIARERVDETKNKNSFTPIVRASKRGSKTPKYKTETKRAA